MPQAACQHTAVLTVSPAEMERLTTLLQSGIILKGGMGMAVGLFLSDLPGFDQTYLNEKVQTIFLDGNAIDDLQRPLTKAHHVLALSAAMPGLAGAIFRKNSLCAALRTRMQSPADTAEGRGESRVCLKLFNTIAQDKGEALLRRGGIFAGTALVRFFENHPSALHDALETEYDGSVVSPQRFLSAIRADGEYFLSIDTAEDRVSP